MSRWSRCLHGRGHELADLLLGFLDELKSKLQAVAEALHSRCCLDEGQLGWGQANGGEPSEDIAALVGAEEMQAVCLSRCLPLSLVLTAARRSQVPHTDLLPGQVQAG